MKRFIQQNIYYYSCFLFLLLLGGVLLLLYSKEEVTLWVNAGYSTFTDYFFWTTDWIGTLWFSIAFILGLWIWKSRKIALSAFACFTLTAIVVQFLKYIVFPGAPRPVLYFEGIADLRLLDYVIQLETESFPSGHTAAAFSIATFLALLLPKKQLHGLFILLAVCVGYGRIYLSQHFITDVYVGMSIGVIVTTLTYYYINKFSPN